MIFRVVTDIPVAHSLAAMVLGDHGTVDLMLERGANAHSYQLRPSQAQALAQADIRGLDGRTHDALDGPRDQRD